MIGILSQNTDSLSIYTTGGQLVNLNGTINTDWTWKHPKMCTSNGTTAAMVPNNVTFASSTCPSGYTRAGTTGVFGIMQILKYMLILKVLHLILIGHGLTQCYATIVQLTGVAVSQGSIAFISDSQSCPTGYN